MKYVNQLEYPDLLYITRTKEEGAEYEKGRTTTIRSSGCGLCSAVMVAHRLLPNCVFDLRDALRISYEAEANHTGGTDFLLFAPEFAKRLGLELEITSDIDRMRYCLSTGGVAIVHVIGEKHRSGERRGEVGLFTRGGHYITAINVERDDRIAILDPSYKDGKFEEDGRVGKAEMRNKVIALCDVQVLAEEVIKSKPAFYLFWRT